MRWQAFLQASRTYAALAVAGVFIGGCAAIPNVSSFNEQTARLKTADAAEFSAISSAYGELIASADRQRQDGRTAADENPTFRSSNCLTCQYRSEQSRAWRRAALSVAGGR